MGDDCAVLNFKPGSILAKVDGVVLGRHFETSTAPKAAGAKLFKRNLSDIAAMGGTPRHALVHLLLARNTSLTWLEQFYRGIAKECRRYGVTVAGGGIAQGAASTFAADLMLLGEAAPHSLTRTGAKIGDALYVTGELGGSILGKHLRFTPRLAEGQWLARQREVRGMIDVSDGLAKDLPAILPEKADARLEADSLPVSAAARQLAQRDGQSAVLHALTDGEDYELLFAVSPKAVSRFEQNWRRTFQSRLTRIGSLAPAVDARNCRQLRSQAGQPLLPPHARGYEHLR